MFAVNTNSLLSDHNENEANKFMLAMLRDEYGFSICEPLEKDMFSTARHLGYRSPLNVNSDQITGGLHESNEPISLGDIALQVSWN